MDSPDTDGIIAKRARPLRSGPLSYIDAFIAALPDLYAADKNPTGFIAMVVAENKCQRLQQRFLQRMAEVPLPDVAVMNYGSMTGSPALKRALCDLLKRTFVDSPSVRFKPDNMAVLSGCTACIDALAFLLADEGEGVLLPTPTYAAFDNDLGARAHLRIVDFELDEDRGDIEGQLDGAVEAARARGVVVRGLLITNPCNPRGILYSDDTIRSMLRWSLDNKVHYIADEIYALSVHADGATFRSAMSVLYEDLVGRGEVSAEVAASFFHLLYGLSKDWCASGLRIGCLYSDNAPLHEALSSLAPMASVSNYQQHLVAGVLNDEAFTAAFVADNRAMLRESYVALSDGLARLGVEYVEAVAGLFLFADLRPWMDEQSVEGEDRLWRSMLDLKVILTPGTACKAKQPGWFRICACCPRWPCARASHAQTRRSLSQRVALTRSPGFAWVEPAAVAEMLHRLGRLLRS